MSTATASIASFEVSDAHASDENEDQLYQEGFDHGFRWAHESAESGQLDRLLFLADEHGEESTSFFINAHGEPYPACDVFSQTACPDMAENPSGYDRFWKSLVAETADTRVWLRPYFVQGCFDGAVSAWRGLKADL